MDMAKTSERDPDVSTQGKRLIVIVEDDTDIGPLLLQAITTEVHYQAVLVSEGTQALALVEHITPELFLLDYHLPGLTGIDLYERLRAHDGLEQVPVILMSADPLASHLAQARGLPYLKKPFKLAVLFARLDELLGA
jgi:DNA-binding response OmpR family regulator